MFASILIAASAIVSAAVTPVWTVQLGAGPLSSPLVADVQGSAGLETIVASQSEVFCVNAAGATLWSAKQDGIAVTIPPALAMQRGGAPSVLVALDGGVIVSLDAATGAERWRSAALGGAILGLLAAPLDTTGNENAVATVAGVGALALDAQGKDLWRYPDDEKKERIAKGAPAAADVDDDGIAEVFVVTPSGPVSIDHEGLERWEADIESPKDSACLIADSDGDLVLELYNGTEELQGIDADLGDEIEVPELGGITNAMAAGDVNGDGAAKVVFALNEGRLLAFQNQGKSMLEMNIKEKPRALLLANINNDQLAEAVVVNKDGSVDALSFHSGELRALAPPGSTTVTPAIADLDGISGAEFVLSKPDGALVCLRLDGPYIAARSPWPQQGGGPARRNAAPTEEEIEKLEGGTPLVKESADALRWALPAEGVARSDQGVWQSQSIALDADSVGMDITVSFASAVNSATRLVWRDGDKVLREDSLRPVPAAEKPMLRLMDAKPPLGARSAHVSLKSEDAASPWSSIEAKVHLARVPSLKVFYNQLGYEVMAPKRVVIATSFPGTDAKIQVLNEKSDVAYEVQAQSIGERILGAHKTDWGAHFWSGDFGAFDTPGTYRLRVIAEGAQAETGTFKIDVDLLWRELFPVVLSAYTAQAPGADVVPVTMALLRSYEAAAWRFREDTGAPTEALTQEIRRGADAARARAEALPAEATADQRAELACILAKAALLLGAQKDYGEQAATLLNRAVADGSKSPDALNAAIDLFQLTQQETYKNAAMSLFTGPLPEEAEASVAYETHVDDSYPTSFYLALGLQDRVKKMMAAATNPFGLVIEGDASNPNYFATPAPGSADALPLGNTGRILDAALQAGRAYRFQPTPDFQGFLLNQINWLCGMNPLGVCFINGVGATNLPSYSTAVSTGAIAAGSSCEAAGSDKPWADLSGSATPDPRTNACSLEYNGKLLELLAQYKRIRTRH